MKTLKKNRKKALLLREFEEMPMIQQACRKVGIARSTYYRWCEQDREFLHRAEYAQGKGRDRLNDIVESKLLENIQAGQQQAIQFWLTNNSKIYRSSNTSWQKRIRLSEQEEFEKHKQIFEFLDMDEAIKLLDGDPSIIGAVLQAVIRNDYKWFITHLNTEDFDD